MSKSHPLNSNQKLIGMKLEKFKMGAVAIGLMIMQPIGAFLRCDVESESRFIFNCLHRFVGFLSLLLARKFLPFQHFFSSNFKSFPS